jgi:UDP-3-O-[3-hydroxymyristoyl] glucosamine N-acyltransferase
MILVENPRYAFAQALNAFFTAPREACIAASARISPTASLGRGVGIGAGSIIGDDCVIGDDTQIRHNVIIGERVQIGARCLVKSNSVIGEEGFGFERGPDGKYLRLPHLGSVIIGDDVEIGALNTVCRGTVGPTTIGRGTKTDDHVHIAHNCSIGEDVIITACAELSGSVTVGDRAWLGPNSSIMNGITIEAGTVVGLGAVIGKSTEENGVYPGSHAALLRIKKR